MASRRVANWNLRPPAAPDRGLKRSSMPRYPLLVSCVSAGRFWREKYRRKRDELQTQQTALRQNLPAKGSITIPSFFSRAS
jgi:hypothetical protein